MSGYIVRRLVQAGFVVLGVSAIAFAVTVMTGDPAALLLPPDASLEQVQALRADLGLDQPVYVQYFRFLANALHGDFGVSIRQHQPVLRLILDRLPLTAQLAAVAFLLSVLVAVPVGVLAAVRRGTLGDTVATGGVLLGQSIPNFWLGMMIILLFGARLGWLPTGGHGSILHLIGPTLTLAAFPTARNVRLVRSSMLEVLGEDYVRTARAKGLSERVVIYRHALRNALLPVVTVIGLQFGFFLSGAVVTETVFAWPGLGRLMVQAISGRDYPLILGGVVMMSVVFILLNLVVDLLYSVIDPRIAVGKGEQVGA